MKRNRAWKIGTIRGVDINLHISLVFLLVYVVLLAAAQFPQVVKQSGIDESQIGGSPSMWSLIFALGLFFSVLLHEFGHVIIAQSLKVKVRSVTLMMLGGVSEMDRVPDQRLGEFKVALAGPLVSFAIAGFLFGLKSWTSSPDISLFSYWLARVNLVLGVFNLIPAIPLDGGRAFRSLLASKKGMEQATAASVGVAKFLAWVFGFVGVVGFNIILILIAFFIYTSADRELLMLRSRKLLKGLRVGDIGKRVPSVSEDDSIEFVAEEMITIQCRTLPVRTRSGALGMITSDDLKQVPKGQWRSRRISSILTLISRVFNVQEALDRVYPELIVSSAGIMEEEGRIVGVIRAQDLYEAIEFRSIANKDFSTEFENESEIKPAA